MGRCAAAGVLPGADGVHRPASSPGAGERALRLLHRRRRPVDRNQIIHCLPAAVRSYQRLDPDCDCRGHCPGAKGNRLMPFPYWVIGVPFSWYLILSAVLFALGVAGFLFRRNVITVFMSIELMLNAVNLSFVAFSYQIKEVDGHIFSFFVMVVAAAEAAVGLAIILTVFKNRATLMIDEVNSMKY